MSAASSSDRGDSNSKAAGSSMAICHTLHQPSGAFELAVNTRPGIRDLAHVYASGVVNRVRDRRSGVEHRVFAQALGAERTGGHRGLHENRHDLGSIEHCRRPIVVERLRYGNAGVWIDEQFFSHRIAESHDGAAIDLRYRTRHMNHSTTVVRAHQLEHRDSSCLHVHFDFREARPPALGGWIPDVEAKTYQATIGHDLTRERFSLGVE